ncbi:hypothetical protein F383_04573 [Gossypium arboreum]|uniref:Uncharacterized protein n=1 Tax=Gossypium arboreum TaxID=29729 RepID=A0A0B0NEL6_GOSAR|nr:hypothetical protein F383_04573 [Gossypium arboreum]
MTYISYLFLSLI